MSTGQPLVVLEGEGRALEVLRDAGIDSNRVVVFSRRPRRPYLDLFNQIDISLDTLPYNGHTTSLDSLWMSVPVVTQAGLCGVSRGGVSVGASTRAASISAAPPPTSSRSHEPQP